MIKGIVVYFYAIAIGYCAACAWKFIHSANGESFFHLCYTYTCIFVASNIGMVLITGFLFVIVSAAKNKDKEDEILIERPVRAVRG